MLIISYFLTFALVISIIIILAPYFRSFLQQGKQHKPVNLGREEFSEEFFPKISSGEVSPVEYKWKGNLSKKSTSEELPGTYQDAKLVLLIKNPTCLYAYWDTTMKFDQGTPSLRIYEATSFEQEYQFSHLFDIDIFPDAKNWFINVPKDNCSYYAELGQRMPDGSFVPILRSNLVKTPRSSLSTAIDENWIPCDIYGRLSNVSYGVSSGFMQKEERKDY
ncbi:MAG: DUF4912 domain-containing protein [Dehalobacterium sp.]